MIDRKAIEERLKIQTRDPFPTTLQRDVSDLLAELDRTHSLHVDEQKRSADRLKIAHEALILLSKAKTVPRTLEGAAVQIEVESIAQEALDAIKEVGYGTNS